MSLTPAQLTALRAACFADPVAAAFFVAPGDSAGLVNYLNTPSAFIVRKPRVESAEIGPVLNYVAVSSLTTANRDRATTFVMLNPQSFIPTADVESYWDTTFGGALGGQGEATRIALRALWRRPALHVERLLATGTGTDSLPGTLTWEGSIPQTVATSLIYKDDGSLWTAGG